MSLVIKNERQFTPAPEGIHDAVCVDVVDMGMVNGPFGPKHKLRIVWEINSQMEDGRNFIVTGFYGASLHEKSNLRKTLKSWRGKDFTEEELRSFDMEKLVGVPAQLVLQHNEHDGKTYCNVAAVTKGKNKFELCGAYVRVRDRETTKTEVAKHAEAYRKETNEVHGESNPF